MAQTSKTKTPQLVPRKTAGGSAPVGRPTVITPEVVLKLEQVFAMDGSAEEAIFYAGISRSVYYDWLKNNPEYSDRFEALRNKPVLKARETVIKDLVTPSGAQWYLSRKRKLEFGSGEEVQKPTGGMNVYNFFFNEQAQEEVKAMENKIKEALIQKKPNV